MASSIKSKLYLIIFGATLPLVVLIVSLVWRDARHEAEGIRAAAMEQAHQVAHELERMAWQMETVLHTAQQLADLGGADREALARYLRRLPESQMPPVRQLAVLDAAGHAVLALDGQGRPALPFTEAAGGERRLQDLQVAHQSAPLVVLGPYLEGPEGEPVILVAWRLARSDGSLGTIAASLPVAHLLEMVRRPQLPAGSVVTIAAADGSIIARSLGVGWDARVWRTNAESTCPTVPIS